MPITKKKKKRRRTKGPKIKLIVAVGIGSYAFMIRCPQKASPEMYFRCTATHWLMNVPGYIDNCRKTAFYTVTECKLFMMQADIDKTNHNMPRQSG